MCCCVAIASACCSVAGGTVVGENVVWALNGGGSVEWNDPGRRLGMGMRGCRMFFHVLYEPVWGVLWLADEYGEQKADHQ